MRNNLYFVVISAVTIVLFFLLYVLNFGILPSAAICILFLAISILFKFSNANTIFRYISIMLMLVAVVLGFSTYSGETGMHPKLLSTLLCVVLLGSLMARGFFQINPREKSTWLVLVILLLDLLFMSSLVSVFVSDETFKIQMNGTTYWDSGLSTMAIMFIAIAVSYLGIRIIAGYAWIVVCILGVLHASKISDAMDIWGAIYIASAFISIVMQAYNEYGFKEMLLSAKQEYCGHLNRVVSDTNVAVDHAGKVAAALTGMPVDTIIRSDMSHYEINEKKTLIPKE